MDCCGYFPRLRGGSIAVRGKRLTVGHRALIFDRMSLERKKRRMIMKQAGLVLEGGANRGIFTAGALDYLMEQGMYFPYVVGTSAGACNAASYVSRQREE